MRPELPTLLSAVVVILALVVYILAFMRVGSMRGKHKIDAPATIGHPEFERAYRVQMNTLEQFAVFLPLLWIATSFPTSMAYLAPAFGLVWIVGRVLYMQGYMSAAEKRGTGFLISLVANGGLLVLGIIGLVRAWMAVHAA